MRGGSYDNFISFLKDRLTVDCQLHANAWQGFLFIMQRIYKVPLETCGMRDGEKQRRLSVVYRFPNLRKDTAYSDIWGRLWLLTVSLRRISGFSQVFCAIFEPLRLLEDLGHGRFRPDWNTQIYAQMSFISKLYTWSWSNARPTKWESVDIIYRNFISTTRGSKWIAIIRQNENGLTVSENDLSLKWSISDSK